MAESENEDDFKQLFIIFSYATILASTTWLEGYHDL